MSEGVADDEVARHAEELGIPGVLPRLVLRQHREDVEVHGAHVHGCELGAPAERSAQPLLARHAEAPAGRDVEHGVAGPPDARQELHEERRVRVRAAVLGVAGVEVDDGGRLHEGRGDLRGRGGEVLRRGRREDATRDGAGDDDGLGRGPPPASGAAFAQASSTRPWKWCAACSDLPEPSGSWRMRPCVKAGVFMPRWTLSTILMSSTWSTSSRQRTASSSI